MDRTSPSEQQVSSRCIRLSRAFWCLGLLIAIAHAGYVFLDLGRGTVDGLAAEWAPFSLFLACAAVCFARGLAYRPERAAWSVLAAGFVLYAAAQRYYVLVVLKDPSPSFPNVADILWLALHVSAMIAIVLLVRAQGEHRRPDLWLDGVLGGLVVASAGVVLIFKLVIEPLAALDAAPANVVFALADLFVVGLGVGSCALLGWRPPRSLIMLICAYCLLAVQDTALLAVQDTAYLSELIRGTLVPGTYIDSWWVFAVLLIAAAAAWPRPGQESRRQPDPRAAVASAVLFALVAVALVPYEGLTARVTPLAIALITLALFTVVLRFALTFRTHLSMIARSDYEAMTDALTKLGNRRKLLHDAGTAFPDATPASPMTLAVFDLDGFKGYNDSYGHPAGDVLLARLGQKLARAVAPSGDAYRLGGDEFCVVVRGAEPERRGVLAAAVVALAEHGEAFSVTSSHGSVEVPGEARNMSDALRRADQRLYAAKDGRASARTGAACDLLRVILGESQPELPGHQDEVARLADAVAGRMGVEAEERRQLVLAASLHDVGKIAIPDAILHKPGPLDDEEWRYMKRHTAIGERFLASIDGLESVSRLVRSTHERFDGRGYPDEVAGEEIPLAARIIFACDSYSAMTTDRAYRVAMSTGEAVAELRRNSGTQFDPDVVDALCAEVAALAEPADGLRLATEVAGPGSQGA